MKSILHHIHFYNISFSFETYLLVLLGALMFIASDVILSFQLFVRPADAPKPALPSIALWFLYYGGQALIAWGVLSNLA